MKHVSLVNFVAADAGSLEQRFALRLSAVTHAVIQFLKDGQRTPLMLVQSACEKYATQKACYELGAYPDRASAESRRAWQVYQAYGAAFKAHDLPERVKGEKADSITVRAEDYALAFVTTVETVLDSFVKVKPVKTAEEKQAAADKKAADAKQAEADAAKAAADAGALEKQLAEEQAAHIKAEAERIAASMTDAKIKEQAVIMAQVMAEQNVPTMEDMLRAVIMGLKTGMFAPEQLAELDDALTSVADVVELVPVETITPAPAMA